MKINYFSDIHLEFGWLETPTTDADLVIAAGDISVGTDAVRWLERCARPVLYVAGNHEYYGGDLLETNAEIKQACDGTNVRFLEQSEFFYEGVRFLGTTLWTDFGNGDEQILAKAATHMNDYHQIRFGERLLKPADIFSQNKQAILWLEIKLAEQFDGKTVVITHHAPSVHSWNPPPVDSTYVATYCNRLETLIEKTGVSLWIHGHIHHSADYQLGSTRVVCNPRGYHGYKPVPSFNESLTVDI